MKKTGNEQINTKVYWNHIYTTPAKEMDYWANTGRFPAVLNEIKDGDKFIDLGCGVCMPGVMVHKHRKNCEIWGVDISDEIIKKGKERFPYMKLSQGYIGYNDFLPDDYFDVVFSGEVIEHLDDPNVLFTEAYRILKKGGKLVITTPEEDAVSSPEHVWEYTKDDVKDLYLSNKFKNVEFINLDDMEHLVIIFAKGEK